jgi:hypothetical protein
MPCLAPAAVAAGEGSGPGPDGTLVVVGRTVALDRVQNRLPNSLWEQYAYWQVDYRLRYDGATPRVVAPADVAAEVVGSLSNSRLPGHGRPKRAAHQLAGPGPLADVADLIESTDESRRCRERAVVAVWLEAAGPPKNNPAEPGPTPCLTLDPGAVVRVRLRLEHLHFLHGSYDPLLGPRDVTIRLGPLAVRDTVPLDRDRKLAPARPEWEPIRPDFLDDRQAVAGPDSLHLEAHRTGHSRYSLEPVPVRYATRMRLSYWYLIAPGTRGECQARLCQYKDHPACWKTLSDGCVEECLTVVGRWVKVERTFRTESEATSLSVDFRIAGADVGELWIDDIRLEPVEAVASGP